MRRAAPRPSRSPSRRSTGSTRVFDGPFAEHLRRRHGSPPHGAGAAHGASHARPHCAQPGRGRHHRRRDDRRDNHPWLDTAGRPAARGGARAGPGWCAGAGPDHVRQPRALLAPRPYPALRQRHRRRRHAPRGVRHRGPQPGNCRPGPRRAARCRRCRRPRAVRRGGALDGCRPHPAHDQGPAVRAAEDRRLRRRPDRAGRRRPALGHGTGSPPVRAHPARAGRCHSGRPQDGRRRQPRADLPPAGPGRPLAAASHSRRQVPHARPPPRCFRPPSACR